MPFSGFKQKSGFRKSFKTEGTPLQRRLHFFVTALSFDCPVGACCPHWTMIVRMGLLSGNFRAFCSFNFGRLTGLTPYRPAFLALLR